MTDAKKHGFPDNCDCPSEDICRFIEARDSLAAARAQQAPAVESQAIGAEGQVIAEHTGCGSGTQVDRITVRLNPGDKVVMVKGAISRAIDRAATPAGEGA